MTSLREYLLQMPLANVYSEWWVSGAALLGALIWTALIYRSRLNAVRRHVQELQTALQQREDAEQAMVESEEWFRTLCDHAPVGIFVNAPNGEGLYVNEKCTEMTGLTHEAAIGTGWRSAIHPEDSERVIKRVESAVSEQQPYHDVNRYVRSDGSIRWVEGMAVPVRRPTGEPLGYIGTLLDITDQKETAEAMRASEARYRAIVNDQIDLIVRWKADGTLLFANDAWCRFQSCSLDDVVGNDFLSVVPEQRRDDLRMWATSVKATDPIATAESRFRTPDGRLHFQFWIEHAIFDDAGTLIEIQSVGRDVTDERESEEQFREQQRMLAHVSRLSTMGELVAGIAHEVNQPLYSIKNCAQALQNILADDSEGSRQLIVECADQISNASFRAGEMIRRMHEFVRCGETERSACDLYQVIEEAIRLVGFEARRNDVSVAFSRLPGEIIVEMDRVQIQQVLVNLLKNAFEAIAECDSTVRNVVASCRKLEQTALTVIADTGPGVASEVTDTVFDAFVTTRKEGMGMGLAISRTIIQAHGGRLWTENGPTGGAAFHFELPLHRASESKQSNEASIDNVSSADISDALQNGDPRKSGRDFEVTSERQ